MASDERVSLHFFAHCVDCGERFNALHLLGLHKDICGGRSHSCILCGHCDQVFDSYRVYVVHVMQLGYDADLCTISGQDDSRKRGGVYPHVLDDFSTESPLSDENLRKMTVLKAQTVRKKKIEKNAKWQSKTKNDNNPIIITSDTADEALDSAKTTTATVSMAETVREWKDLIKTVGINQISLKPTLMPTVPQATITSAEGNSANELAYYKKAALFFASGIRTMNEVASDVPPNFWPDDHLETCPYRAQIRESSWPSNFPDVGQCEPKELLTRMAENAGQILEGPCKQPPTDNSMIDDIIGQMLQTEDDDLMALSGNLFGEEDDLMLGPSPDPM